MVLFPQVVLKTSEGPLAGREKASSDVSKMITNGCVKDKNSIISDNKSSPKDASTPSPKVSKVGVTPSPQVKGVTKIGGTPSPQDIEEARIGGTPSPRVEAKEVTENCGSGSPSHQVKVDAKSDGIPCTQVAGVALDVGSPNPAKRKVEEPAESQPGLKVNVLYCSD